jgi:hypothetical protein
MIRSRLEALRRYIIEPSVAHTQALPRKSSAVYTVCSGVLTCQIRLALLWIWHAV